MVLVAEVDNAIERVIEQLVSEIPWHSESKLGLRLTRRLFTPTLEYLTHLYSTFPYDAMDATLRSLGIQEVDPPPSEIDDLIAEWILAEGAPSTAGLGFEASLAAELQLAALEAAAAALSDTFATSVAVGDIGVGVTGQVGDWARKHAGSLINDLDDATRARLGEIIAQGLEHQDGVEGIRRSLESFLTDLDLTKSRAETIARTETADAMSQGAHRANAAVGAEEKRCVWFGGPDPAGICQANEGEGRIPINQVHISGHMHPTFHPRCKCAELYFGADPAKLGGVLN